MELKGKFLAELRNKEIKEIVIKLEEQRDELYDEIANRKGRAEVIEDLIKGIYDRIIQVNKEVRQQDLVWCATCDLQPRNFRRFYRR